jgi:hypothetical protein
MLLTSATKPLFMSSPIRAFSILSIFVLHSRIRTTYGHLGFSVAKLQKSSLETSGSSAVSQYFPHFVIGQSRQDTIKRLICRESDRFRRKNVYRLASLPILKSTLENQPFDESFLLRCFTALMSHQKIPLLPRLPLLLEDAATEYLKKDLHCMIRFRIYPAFKPSGFVRMEKA